MNFRLNGENGSGCDGRDRDGYFEGNARAVGTAAGQRDFPAAFLRDAVANAQAQACALADGLGGVKRIERSIQICEAGPRILELDDDAPAVARGADANLALFAFFHRVDRIVQNVQQHLFQFVFADADSHITSSEGVHVIRLPEHYGQLSAILHVIPLQLLAYHTALARGTDVDKPRNLAKSVTVE